MLVALIVQKYGGSSLADLDCIRRVARRIVATRRKGNRVLAVVSAMGSTTDELTRLAYEITPSPQRRELDMLLRTLESKLRVWSLARHSGYVRMPQAYADLGWTWALSGQPGLAVAGLRKAMELMPEGHRSQLKQTLAGLYLAQEDDARSAALYRLAMIYAFTSTPEAVLDRLIDCPGGKEAVVQDESLAGSLQRQKRRLVGAGASAGA